MKAVLALIVFAASALAQGPSVRVPSACGNTGVNFDVKLDKTQRPQAQPESGRATVYFIQDDGPWGEHQHYVIRIALDGAWVGAYKWNSYSSVSVEPGVHHVCANVQTHDFPESVLAFAHFTAEPGKVYYFRTRFLGGIFARSISPPSLDLDPLDSDEAKYLIATYPLSVSSAKK